MDTKVKSLFLAALIMVFSSFQQVSHAKHHNAEKLINCDIQNAVCTQKLGDMSVTLQITPKPVKAMEDLAFQVKVDNAAINKEPYIDLGMPGMKMGPNRVQLKRIDPGVYEGSGVIVRCPSGKTIWRATVTIPDNGQVDFIFNVFY